MDDSLQNILFGDHAFHILDQIISILGLIIFQVENYQVQSSLRNYIYQRWKNLESVFSASKNSEIVPEKVIFLDSISRC